MSLTREEWGKMWESIKIIEYASDATAKTSRLVIKREVEKIKKQIESVIGQME